MTAKSCWALSLRRAHGCMASNSEAQIVMPIFTLPWVFLCSPSWRGTTTLWQAVSAGTCPKANLDTQTTTPIFTKINVVPCWQCPWNRRGGAGDGRAKSLSAVYTLLKVAQLSQRRCCRTAGCENHVALGRVFKPLGTAQHMRDPQRGLTGPPSSCSPTTSRMRATEP